MVGTFGQKPSNAHVVWTNRPDGEGRKRFDFEYLELWAANFGIDYETRRRVDHERADEPREQHLVVFEWERGEGETLELGGETWEMTGGKTPRTFLEIDETGTARLRSWEAEVVLDLRELWLDGEVIRLETAEHGNKAIDARTLLADD